MYVHRLKLQYELFQQSNFVAGRDTARKTPTKTLVKKFKVNNDNSSHAYTGRCPNKCLQSITIWHVSVSRHARNEQTDLCSSIFYIWEIPGPNYKLTAGFHVFMSLQIYSIIHLIRPQSPPTTLFPAYCYYYYYYYYYHHPTIQSSIIRDTY